MIWTQLAFTLVAGCHVVPPLEMRGNPVADCSIATGNALLATFQYEGSPSVLLGGASRLRPFYQLMLAQEAGEWKTASELTSQLQLSESDVAEFYWQAMQWARQVSAGT